MYQTFPNEEALYRCYEQLPKSEYTFLLCRIKDYDMLPYLYGKECDIPLYEGMTYAFSQVLTSKDYAYHPNFDHCILFIHHQDAYTIIQYIYQIDQQLETYHFKGIHHHIALSYGIYFMCHDVDFYQAYDHAKFALQYSHDRKKYNTTFEFYDPQENDRILQQFVMQSDVEEALRTHEFEIYLQAKVDAKTHHIRGAEALIRWVRQGKEVPLKEFMPLIDANTFIRRIDLFVLDEVCKLITRWKKENIPLLPISVNISRASFEDGFYYLREVIYIFSQYQIDKSLIEFELSEGICFHDDHRLHRFLMLLQEEGFSCSLDDFGSGYSSFHSLTYLPVKTIKLDSSFCLGIWNEKRAIVLESILNLLKTLGFEIVVEGVETEELVTFFSQHPCDLLQGFYFHKPQDQKQFLIYYQQINQW